MKNQKYADFGLRVLRASREDAGISIMKMAESIGVSHTAIWKWETGQSCPDMIELDAWFDACGLNKHPYLVRWKYPEIYKTSDNNVTAALYHAIDLMTIENQQRLLWAITGDHGSMWPGVLQMIMAHLHLPLKMRIVDATELALKYKLVKAGDELANPNTPQPDTQLLEECVRAGTAAFMAGKKTYTVR